MDAPLFPLLHCGVFNEEVAVFGERFVGEMLLGPTPLAAWEVEEELPPPADGLRSSLLWGGCNCNLCVERFRRSFPRPDDEAAPCGWP